MTASPADLASPAKLSFRLRACLASIWMAVAGSAFAAFYGAPFQPAVLVGAAAAVGGLAGWWAYHLLSRREDGLMFLGLGFGNIVGRDDAPPDPTRVLIVSTVVCVLVGSITGLFGRTKTTGKGRAKPSGSPLPDADLDGWAVSSTRDDG